jgi:uncharacterized protein involved in exopolysaccharide biosynthesis
MAQRRMPAMVVLFLLCNCCAFAIALKLPATYSASASLLVEPPQISGTESLVVDDLAQLQIIEQRLMVRANLIDIADRYDVFPDRDSMSADDIVQGMRDRTTFESSSGRDEATLLSVSFDAGEAQTAFDVVNSFMSLVLQDNVRVRTRRAEGVLAFFNREIERLSVDLDRQSEKIISFKATETEALPEDQPYRLERIADLQERIAQTEREIAGHVQRRKSVLNANQSIERLKPQTPSNQTDDQRQLQALKRDLSTARVIFSETNPRVIILQGQIKALEDAIIAQADLKPNTSPSFERSNVSDIKLAEINGALESLRSELVQSSEELGVLRDAVERALTNKITLDGLERDYGNLQSQYNAAVERRNEAQMNLQLELDTKGQRLTLIEKASLPSQPSSPNRPLIGAAGIAFGLVMAAGLFCILEFLNRSIRRPIELTNALGITPLTTIPHMEDELQKLSRRNRLVARFLIIVIGMPAVLWAVDSLYLPLDVIAGRALGSLGL